MDNKTTQSDLFADHPASKQAAQKPASADASVVPASKVKPKAPKASAPMDVQAGKPPVLGMAKTASKAGSKTGVKREVFITPKAKRLPKQAATEENTTKARKHSPTQNRESLLKKRAARLAAVQALYGASFHDALPPAHKIAAQILSQWEDSKADRDGLLPTDTMPDKALLGRILEGVILHRNTVDTAIESLILPGWSKQRMDGVLLAILQAAGAEWIISTRALPMLVDEYTTIGEAMLGEEETAYLHKAVHLLCESLPRVAAQ